MLIEETLFGEIDKVQQAIYFLREHEPKDGYYMGFSGGKDSTVAYDLCKRAGVKVFAQYCVTTVDPPEVVQFVKKHYPEIWENRLKAKKSMWQLIVENGIYPSRIARYCCRVFKEVGGGGRDIVTGIRAEESPRRAKRAQYEPKKGDKGHFYCHPIFKWTKEDVWEYIHKYNLPYCKLYDEGYERVGCILCPFQSKANMQRDIKKYPKYVTNYIKAGDRAVKRRMEKGLPTKWKNGTDMFTWWKGEMSKTHIAESCDSVPLFSEDDGSVL